MKQSIIVLICLIFLCGCASIEPADSSNGNYSAQYPQTALEYNLFMSKHLTIIANQINARIIATRNAEKSFSTAEKTTAKESYDLLMEEINIIKATEPAKTYESTRESVLVTIDLVQQHYEEYLSALDNHEDITSYSMIFENDYNEVTSLCTLYNN